MAGPLRAEVVARRKVSRETADRLDRYETLLRQWQRRTNLVAPSTLEELWVRHFEEGLILADLMPAGTTRIVDLGSGGGLPGLVLAILAKESGGAQVDLVESNGKKAAFLRAVTRELDLPCTVHAERIEACGAIIAKADLVTARALAPLDTLLGFVGPALSRDALCLFPKGRTHGDEIAQASRAWRFAMVKHDLTTDPGSVVLEIRRVEPIDRTI